MNATILGLDAGVTSLSCILFDANGEALASAVAPYDIDFPESGWAEQPVDRLFTAACQAIREVTRKTNARSIAAIGLSGAMNSLIPIDAAGAALYANIVSADARAREQLDAIRAVIPDDEYYARTGGRIDVHASLAKMLWLRDNRPDVYQKTRCFIHTKDALYGFLTGRYGLSDYTDASLTGALNIERGRWDAELLSALQLDVVRMPQLRVSHDVEGHLTRNAARLLGLMGGIPVSIGGVGGACAAHGAGVSQPADAYCNLGASAWLSALSDAPVLDVQKRVFNYFDLDGRRYHVCGMVQSAASALQWASAQLLLPAGAPDAANDFRAMEALAEASQPGAQGVFFLPMLMGERTPWWDPNARGTLVGLSMHHTRADIARAIYEGVAQAIHLCGDALAENDLSFESLTMIGGGAESAIWPQMFADVFGMAIRVHANPREATPLGAAMTAGVGIDLFPGYPAASHMARFAPEIAPNPAHHVAYIPHFSIYRAIYPHLRTVYRDVTEYQLSRFGKIREHT